MDMKLENSEDTSHRIESSSSGPPASFDNSESLEAAFHAIRLNYGIEVISDLLSTKLTADNVNSRCGGRTLVMEAALYRRIDVLNLLLKDEGEVTSTESAESTSIYFYPTQGQAQVAVPSTLLPCPDLDLTNDFDGFSALMEGVYRGSLEVVKKLLQNGAGIFHRSSQIEPSCPKRGLWHHGKTALDMARILKHKEIEVVLNRIYSLIYAIYILAEGFLIHLDDIDVDSIYSFL